MKRAGDPDEQARVLQDMTRDSEKSKPGYKAEDVSRAVVHTREDLVLVVSYLSSIAELLGSIKKLLVIIAVAAVVSAVALMWPF